MLNDLDLTRRDVLKGAATGAVGLGLAGAAVVSTDRYIVGATSAEAVMAASSVSDSLSRRIDLGEYGTLLAGHYSSGMRASLQERDDVRFVQPDHVLRTLGSRDGGSKSFGAVDGFGTSGKSSESGESGSSGGAGALESSGGPDELGSSGERSTSGVTPAGRTMPWGIDRVDADVAHDEGDVGEGAHVAIVDTGIDDAHPDLEAPLADPGDDGNHRAWTECSREDCNYPWSDDGDHGTHVSGTVGAADRDAGVVGVAPSVTLHALKVCSGGGACRTSDTADAIRHAADQGWDVANLSLGSPRESPALEIAGQYATAKGLLLVASAGNSGPCDDCVGYPAAYDEYVTVTATSIDDTLARFSSTGPEVELAAPGEAVCSSVVDGYDTFSGTSMASPHVTGTGAQLIADGYATAEAREQLRDSAEDVDLGDDEQGTGLVDTAAALGLDSGDDGTGDGTACPK